MRTRILSVSLAAMIMFPAGAAAADGEPASHKLARAAISETLNIAPKNVQVLDSAMSYLELGQGDPILFVHGNPTSSYLWRNVMPHVSGNGRAIAVDLIGMGGSGKPDIGYTFADHYRYFDAFVDALDLRDVTLVGHDWGAALSWEYARRNPDRVRRLAFMEGVLPPAFPAPSFEAMGEEMGGMFRAFKDPVQGHKMVVEDNMFVEQILPGFVNRSLGAEAMDMYRQPYVDAAARAPVLAWPRQVPIAGEPADTVETLNGIGSFMAETEMPVLLLYAEPGAIVPRAAVDWYVATIPALETGFVGQGFHYIQEDQPDAIGRAIADWMRRN
jgi:haloalkane dehalogenase